MLVILKPDAVREHKVGQLISEIEMAGFNIVHSDFRVLSLDVVRRLYEDHIFEEYWERLLKSMTEGPCCILQVSYVDVVAGILRLDDLKAAVRASRIAPYNLIHTSDTFTAARRELAIFHWSFDDSPSCKREVLQDTVVLGDSVGVTVEHLGVRGSCNVGNCAEGAD